MSKKSADLAEFIRSKGPHCLILARHGETDWNVQGRLQGQRNVPLNTRGRRQAQVLAGRLESVLLAEVHSSVLSRCLETAGPIARANMARPEVSPSHLLKETGLGVLEGEFKARQSTPVLTRCYGEFSRDEIRYRAPGAENLGDVYARVEVFLGRQPQTLAGDGTRLIVGHRNLNKMFVKHLFGVSFEQALRVEQENQRLYLFFANSKELWSCWVEDDLHELSEVAI